MSTRASFHIPVPSLLTFFNVGIFHLFDYFYNSIYFNTIVNELSPSLTYILYLCCFVLMLVLDLATLPMFIRYKRFLIEMLSSLRYEGISRDTLASFPICFLFISLSSFSSLVKTGNTPLKRLVCVDNLVSFLILAVFPNLV